MTPNDQQIPTATVLRDDIASSTLKGPSEIHPDEVPLYRSIRREVFEFIHSCTRIGNASVTSEIVDADC